jgi:hypothetical protein
MAAPLRWKHPFTCICAGPSCCGKTTFVVRFLQNINDLVDGKIDRVIWCCSPNSRPNEELKGVEFQYKVPTFENPRKIPTLYIIDDLMHDCYNKGVSELFTRGSHHSNISVILITQNVFYQSPQSRNISLNAKYITVFKNPRDRSQFRYLASQVYPENSGELLRVYKEVTSKPFTYLVLDLSQETDDRLRFRTDIFPGEITSVFTPSGTENYEEIETQQASPRVVKDCRSKVTKVDHRICKRRRNKRNRRVLPKYFEREP